MTTTKAITATSPDGTKTALYTGKRKVVFATWAKDRKTIDGKRGVETEWIHLGWTSSTDEKKAISAGKSTNKYFMTYQITPAA
jgi:hypothetical protein